MLLDEMSAAEILMTVEYCTAKANSPLWCVTPHSSVAFSSPAKCSEPGPHPVHTQTWGAGECLRHAAVSR